MTPKMQAKLTILRRLPNHELKATLARYQEYQINANDIETRDYYEKLENLINEEFDRRNQRIPR